MQAFSKCKNYEDYLQIITESMIEDTHYQETNEKGILYLKKIEDKKKQSKIIKIMKRIDSQLSYNGTKSNEMYKKIDYLLSIGIFAIEEEKIFNEINWESLFVLIYGEYSSINDYNRDFLNLFANEELLQTIKTDNDEKEAKKMNTLFEYSDYFFMIRQHYNKKPFDLSNEKEREEFRKEMIQRIKNDTLHDGVMNMIEYWNSDEAEDIRRAIYR